MTSQPCFHEFKVTFNLVSRHSTLLLSFPSGQGTCLWIVPPEKENKKKKKKKRYSLDRIVIYSIQDQLDYSNMKHFYIFCCVYLSFIWGETNTFLLCFFFLRRIDSLTKVSLKKEKTFPVPSTGKVVRLGSIVTKLVNI